MQSLLGDTLSCWAGLIVRFRWGVVLTMSALTLGSLHYTVNNLEIDTDLADMISSRLPFRQTYEQYKRLFPEYVDTLVIVVEADTPELAHQTAARLQRELQGMPEQFRSVYLPGGDDFFERQSFLYMDLLELENQADRLAAVQPFLGKLTQDMSLRGLLSMLGSALDAVREGEIVDLEAVLKRLNTAVESNLSGEQYRVSWQEMMLGDQSEHDQRRQFVVVQPRLNFSAVLAAEQAVITLRALIRNIESHAEQGLRIRLTGSVALEYEELESVSKGAGIAALAALVMVLAVLIAGLRSLRLVFAVISTLLAGLLITAGFATLAVGALNLISIAFAVLYIGLGVDFGIHLCLRYQELRRQGISLRSSLIETARGVGSSLMLCAVTTAVGFYAFLPTGYAGVSELGLISGTGMFISLALSLSLLPALLAILKPADFRYKPKRKEVMAWSFFVELPYRHGAAVIRIALVMAAISLLALTQIRFDYNPINLRDPHSESVTTLKDLVANSETPPWSAIALTSQATELERIKTRLETLSSVSKAVAITDFVPQNQQEKLAIIEDIALILGPELGTEGGKPTPALDDQIAALHTFVAVLDSYLAAAKDLPWRDAVQGLRLNLAHLVERLALSDAASKKADIAALEQSMLHYLPNSLRLLRSALLAHEFSMDDLPAEVVRRWISAQGYYRIEVFPREDISENTPLRRFVGETRSVVPDVTGEPVISLEAANVVIGAFQQAFAGALIVITLILVLILRRINEVLLVLSPLLFAGLLTTALFIASGSVFNYANIIALPLLLGMGVDNGIHMVSRMRDADAAAHINLLKTSTARAVLLSALTTVVSFGNLSLSSHPGTASMGKMLAIGVLVTVLSTLILLPAMLNRRQPSRPVHR